MYCSLKCFLEKLPAWILQIFDKECVKNRLPDSTYSSLKQVSNIFDNLF